MNGCIASVALALTLLFSVGSAAPYARNLDAVRSATPHARSLDAMRSATPHARSLDAMRSATPHARSLDAMRSATPHARSLNPTGSASLARNLDTMVSSETTGLEVPTNLIAGTGAGTGAMQLVINVHTDSYGNIEVFTN